MTFDIQLSGWKAWAGLLSLVVVGVFIGLGARHLMTPSPYASAAWALIDETGGDCVYARHEIDRQNVEHMAFASYERDALTDTPTCPRNANSMVIVDGQAVLARHLPE